MLESNDNPQQGDTESEGSTGLRASLIEQKIMRKLISIIGGLALVAGTGISAGPAVAASDDGIQQTESSPVSESNRVDELLESGEEVDPLELVPGATTDPDQVKKIDESGVPATVVVDPDDGKVVAAKGESGISAHKISIVGPGCSAASGFFCMRGANYYGFKGTGTKTGKWKSIRWYHTGNKQGTVKYNGKWQTWSPKNRAVQLTKKVTVTGLKRQ
ncbi:hypothetical protein [Brevibacterium sediminis]|nr:hypothetical protein [Brevibacterium sediminis]